jgi:hypothetical protein
MAVGSYYDVYSVSQYERRVSDIKTSVANLKNGEFFI